MKDAGADPFTPARLSPWEGSALQCEQLGGRPPSRAGTGGQGARQWVDSAKSMKAVLVAIWGHREQMSC